jgi:hypothetical protein
VIRYSRATELSIYISRGVRNSYDSGRYNLSQSLTEVISPRAPNRFTVARSSTGTRGEEKAKKMMMESVHAAADSTTMRAVNEKYDAMWRTSSSNAFFLACTSLKVIIQASTVFKTAVQISRLGSTVLDSTNSARDDALSIPQSEKIRRTLKTAMTQISDVIFGRQKRLAGQGEI